MFTYISDEYFSTFGSIHCQICTLTQFLRQKERSITVNTFIWPQRHIEEVFLQMFVGMLYKYVCIYIYLLIQHANIYLYVHTYVNKYKCVCTYVWMYAYTCTIYGYT